MFVIEDNAMDKKIGRNAAAVAANFRNSAGSMKDKRTPRGGAQNNTRGFLAAYDEDREIAEEVARAGEPEPSLNDFVDTGDDFDPEPDFANRAVARAMGAPDYQDYDDTWMDDNGDGYDDWMDEDY